MRYRILAIQVDDEDRIQAVQLTNDRGTMIETWSRQRVVNAILAKKHEFFTANTVWSPVSAVRRTWLTTRKDACDHSNLKNLPRF